MNALHLRPFFHWHPASVVAALCGMLICGGPARVGVAAADTTTTVWRSDSLLPYDSWNTLSLDLRVTRRRVDSAGADIGAPSPAVSYHLVRSSVSGSWKTVITVNPLERASAFSLSAELTRPLAPVVSRIEDDEDGSPVRLYGADGQPLSFLQSETTTSVETATSSPRTVGRDWLDNVVATPLKQSNRYFGFQRQFGPLTWLNGLQRFVRTSGDTTEEVLVDPRTELPVESNLMRGTALMLHRTFAYAPAPQSSTVRASIHSEAALNPSSGERLIIDTFFSNVGLERR